MEARAVEKIYRSITQKKLIDRGSFQFQLISEYWSNDERIDIFFSTLQYSITPLLQGRDFQELWHLLNYPFIGYNFENLMRLWFPINIGSSETHGESPQPYQINTTKKGVKLMDEKPKVGVGVNKMALLHPKALGAS